MDYSGPRNTDILNLKGKIKLNETIIENLVENFLLKKFDNSAPIPDCHREWWKMVTSDSKFVAIGAPRGHAKSTAITFSYTLASILFHAHKFIIILSDTEAQAILFLGDIKKELIENEELVALFGIKGLIKDSDSDFIIEFNDGFQARVIAKGSNQRLRGLKWDGARPDLVIGDDLENEDIVLNADRREKFSKWFTGAVIPLLSKDGKIRVVGTVLHMDSQLARLLPKPSTKGVVVTPLVIKSSPRSVWLAALYRAHPSMNDFSEVLWPEHKNKQELLDYQAHCRSEGLMDVYSAEILNDPVDEANARFRKSDMLPMTSNDFEKHRYYYIGTDFAVTKDAHRDYTVFVIASVGDDEMLQIEHVIRERMNSHDIIETIISLQKSYEPLFFAFEKGSILNSLLPGIKVRQLETNTFINYEAFASSVDKDARASTIKARVKAHRVKFNKEADWWPAFEEELLKFPKGHDDQVDAFAIIGNLLNKVARAETQEELEEQEYENFKTEFMFFGTNDSRNRVTGY